MSEKRKRKTIPEGYVVTRLLIPIELNEMYKQLVKKQGWTKDFAMTKMITDLIIELENKDTDYKQEFLAKV